MYIVPHEYKNITFMYIMSVYRKLHFKINTTEYSHGTYQENYLRP